jgi:hypothetical protein
MRAQQRARQAIGVGAVAFACAQVGLLAFLELGVSVRDPEYARHLAAVRQQTHAHPDRPLFVALGSSRLALGLAPAQLPTTGPLLVNCGLIGGGPGFARFCLERLRTDGVRPTGVLLEIWPPFLHEVPGNYEVERLDPNRLCHRDLAQWADHRPVVRKWRHARLNPWSAHRFVLLSLLSPQWLPWHNRRDFTWGGLDDWGWMPGQADAGSPELRHARWTATAAQFTPLLAQFALTPQADANVRAVLTQCQAEQMSATLLLLPEASAFRGLYPPTAESIVQAYLTQLHTTFAVRIIDARTWLSDDDFYDGYHLTRAGATRFTQRLGHALAEVHP